VCIAILYLYVKKMCKLKKHCICVNTLLCNFSMSI
jgi:hypothetical protein